MVVIIYTISTPLNYYNYHNYLLREYKVIEYVYSIGV